MSKAPPPGRWPGWSRTAAPWAPAGGPTAPSPSPWEVTVRPRSRRLCRPGRAGRRARGACGGRVGTVRREAARSQWQLEGCCSLFWASIWLLGTAAVIGNRGKVWTGRAARSPLGVRRPPAERGHPGLGSGWVTLRKLGLVVPEGDEVRACVDAGRPGAAQGHALPAGAPAGHGTAGRQDRAAPPGRAASRGQVTPVGCINTHRHSFNKGVAGMGKMVAFMVALGDFIFLSVSSIL